MISRILFALATASGLGLIGLDAASARVLVETPPTEPVVRDPSVRAGSSHRHSWFVVGGGYHGGK